MTVSEITDFFKSKKFRATPQRIAVYKFLMENHIHPDVQEVYDNVIKDNPSFSKTTVYNALQALTEKGLIIPVMIDNKCIHYDADTKLHGHFKCVKCGKIYDFTIHSIETSGLDGLEIQQKDVYYSGLCPECKNK